MLYLYIWDRSESTLSPVAPGDITLSINIQYTSNRVKVALVAKNFIDFVIHTGTPKTRS